MSETGNRRKKLRIRSVVRDRRSRAKQAKFVAPKRLTLTGRCLYPMFPTMVKK